MRSLVSALLGYVLALLLAGSSPVGTAARARTRTSCNAALADGEGLESALADAMADFQQEQKARH